MPDLRTDHMALYVHLPFCARKCPYCAFASSEFRRAEDAGRVVEAILREAHARRREAPWDTLQVHSLFLGGGTPSTLRGGQIRQLVDSLREIFPFTEDAECTIEVNPGTVNEEKIDGWRAAGLNRISLGVQSLHPPTLQRLGRIHSADQARKAYDRLVHAGFKQMSIDLMYGIEVEQALAGWIATVEEVVTWAPDHLSAYALTIEPGTPYAREVEAGTKVKPDEEVEMAQYDEARTRLVGAGFEHYEVSNWARPGHRCRHNISYWDGGSYLALGPAGHSYDATRQERFWNDPNTFRWLDLVKDHEVGEAGSEKLDALQLYEERVVLDLRMVEGGDEAVFAEYARRAGTTWPPPVLDDLIRRGLLERVNGRLRYTERGHHLADELETVLTR